MPEGMGPSSPDPDSLLPCSYKKCSNLNLNAGKFTTHHNHYGFRQSRRCSRDTYPESYITKYILIYED